MATQITVWHSYGC